MKKKIFKNISIQPAAIESLAKILIIDKQKRGLILMLGKHLKSPEKSFLPDLPGGIVDVGESELSAAIREVQEECGIDLDPAKIQLVYTQTAYYEKENKTVSKLLYVAYVEDAPEVTLSWEHSDYKWIPVDELSQVALRPFFKEAIAYSLLHGHI